MAKPKYKVPSERVRLDGNLRMSAPGVTLDPREQKFFDWYLAHRDDRKAFGAVKDFMVAILNGELGATVQAAVVDGNTEEAIDALQDLLGAFGGEEEVEDEENDFIIPTPDPHPSPLPDREREREAGI